MLSWPPPRLSAWLRAGLLSCSACLGCGEDVLRLGAGPEPATVGRVDNILLREAATGALLGDLADGVALSIAALASPQVSLEAVVSGPVASVEFVVDGKANVEVVVPFTYPGDTNGVLNGFAAAVGAHAVAATPFSLEGAKGERGATVTRSFTFVE